jgi:hypothetical protein
MKRGQEEMIGFVLIIVLVAVIALVFIAIQIRKPGEIQDSKEIQNFLYSSLKFTTECKMNNWSFENVGDLVEDCYLEEDCLNGDSCRILNRTFSGLINSNFNKENWRIEIYKGNETGILDIQKGNKTGRMEGGEVIIGDRVRINLKVYS